MNLPTPKMPKSLLLARELRRRLRRDHAHADIWAVILKHWTPMEMAFQLASDGITTLDKADQLFRSIAGQVLAAILSEEPAAAKAA